jgi:hypothetical protein
MQSICARGLVGSSRTVVEEADEAAVDVGVVGLQLGGLLERRQRGRILAWCVAEETGVSKRGVKM